MALSLLSARLPALGRECRAGRAHAQSPSSVATILPPRVSWLTPVQFSARYNLRRKLYS